ncbi:UNVERIFIED_CONTAM: hypothetical protein K2H54_063438 [Gekko kuhli]
MEDSNGLISWAENIPPTSASASAILSTVYIHLDKGSQNEAGNWKLKTSGTAKEVEEASEQANIEEAGEEITLYETADSEAAESREAVVELRSAKANAAEVAPVFREHLRELLGLANLSIQESPRMGKELAPKDLDLHKDLLTEQRTLEPGFQRV